jgi:hypothetical protein
VKIEGTQLHHWPNQIVEVLNKNSVNHWKAVKSTHGSDIHLVLNQTPIIFLRRVAAQSVRSVLGVAKFSALVILEPKTVIPFNSGFWTTGFSSVMRPGALQHNGKVEIFWPNPKSAEIYHSGNPRSDKVCMIIGNHVSFIGGEMYSLRRRCVDDISDLALYGRGWDMSRQNKLKVIFKAFLWTVASVNMPRLKGPKSFMSENPRNLGSVANKLETLSQYKFALVIENTLDYTSEKLYDSLIAGCVPIYVGPEIDKDSLLREIVVTAEPNTASILDAIALARNLDFAKWDADRLDFLSGEFIERHSSDFFLDHLSKELKRATNEVVT